MQPRDLLGQTNAVIDDKCRAVTRDAQLASKKDLIDEENDESAKKKTKQELRHSLQAHLLCRRADVDIEKAENNNVLNPIRYSEIPIGPEELPVRAICERAV